MAWQRWQALSELDKARIILSHTQSGPRPGELEALTAEKARAILALVENRGDRGTRISHEYVRQTIRREEEAAYEKRREAIVQDIARLGAKAAPALIAEIAQQQYRLDDAMKALTQMGDQAVPALIKAYNREPDGRVRGDLMETLSWIESPKARRTFLRGLEDRSASVRRAALYGLESIGAATQEMYLRSLDDEDDSVRSIAIGGLAKMGDEKAIPPLQRIARTDPARAKLGDYLLREPACRALQEIAKRRGIHVERPPEDVLRR